MTRKVGVFQILSISVGLSGYEFIEVTSLFSCNLCGSVQHRKLQSNGKSLQSESEFIRSGNLRRNYDFGWQPEALLRSKSFSSP